MKMYYNLYSDKPIIKYTKYSITHIIMMSISQSDSVCLTYIKKISSMRKLIK